MRLLGSLRLRMTAAATFGCAIVLTVGALSVAGYSQDRQLDQVDKQLRADARLTQRLIETKTRLPDLGDTGLIVQVYARDGAVVGGNAAGNRADPLFTDPVPWTGTEVPAARTVQTSSLGQTRTWAVPIPGRSSWIVTARSTDDLRSAAHTLRHTLLIAVPTLTLAIGVLTWIVVGRALRPVERIRATVNEISDRDLSQRLEVRGTGDEIDRLAATMNAMLARLEAASERERRLVADASHELRSPLAAAQALIQSRPTDPDEAARHDEVALDALNRLQSIVDQLLELARNDQHQAPPARPVDLDDLVLQHAEILRRTTDLTIDSASVSGGQVLGSKEALGRLVENLATNAARHARSTVRFTVDELGDRVELVVADDGPGIAAADRATVFERFTRLDDSRTRADAGAGLGLAIVASIVRRHGGSVSVGDGIGLDGGTSVTVLLPANGSAGAVDRAAP